MGLHYLDPTAFNAYYKISRLPLNLYELVLRGLFRENAAQIIGGFFLLGTSIFAILAISKRIFNQTTALVMTIMVASFPLIISTTSTGGSDYPNIFAMPLFFLTLAAIVAWDSSNKNREWIALLSGVFLAALLIIYPLYLQMLPCILLIALVALLNNGQNLKRDLAQVLLWSILGGSCFIITLMLINKFVGRGFFFFMPQVRYITHMILHPKKDIWWIPLSKQDFINNKHLGFLFAWGICAFYESVRIFWKKSWQSDRMALAIHAGYLLELFIWTLWQLRSHTTLLPSYFAHPLYGIAVLSIGSVINRHCQGVSKMGFSLTLIMLPLITIISIVHATSVQSWGNFFDSPSFFTGFVFLLFFLLLTFLPILLKKISEMWARGLALIVIVLFLPLAISTTAKTELFKPTACHFNAQFNRYIINSEIYINRLVRHSQNVFVYADPLEKMPVPNTCKNYWDGRVNPIAHSFKELGSSSLYNPWPKMQSPDKISLKMLSEKFKNTDDIIAVFSSRNGKTANHLVERFAKAGIKLKLNARIDPGLHVPLPSIYLYRPQSMNKKK